MSLSTKVRSQVRTASCLLLVLAAGSLVAAPSQAASRVPGCVASHLTIVHGAREGAAGHRFDRFRITNTGATTCRLHGYPTFQFRNGTGHLIGFTSTPAGVPTHVVRLHPGQHTRVTVGTVDPGVTMASQCRARHAASVDIKLAHRPHVYNVSDPIRVCTTQRYRPTSYPVGF